jgi:hypothetical protein
VVSQNYRRYGPSQKICNIGIDSIVLNIVYF